MIEDLMFNLVSRVSERWVQATSQIQSSANSCVSKLIASEGHFPPHWSLNPWFQSPVTTSLSTWLILRFYYIFLSPRSQFAMTRTCHVSNTAPTHHWNHMESLFSVTLPWPITIGLHFSSFSNKQVPCFTENNNNKTNNSRWSASGLQCEQMWDHPPYRWIPVPVVLSDVLLFLVPRAGSICLTWCLHHH